MKPLEENSKQSLEQYSLRTKFYFTLRLTKSTIGSSSATTKSPHFMNGTFPKDSTEDTVSWITRKLKAFRLLNRPSVACSKTARAITKNITGRRHMFCIRSILNREWQFQHFQIYFNSQTVSDIWHYGLLHFVWLEQNRLRIPFLTTYNLLQFSFGYRYHHTYRPCIITWKAYFPFHAEKRQPRGRVELLALWSRTVVLKRAIQAPGFLISHFRFRNHDQLDSIVKL